MAQYIFHRLPEMTKHERLSTSLTAAFRAVYNSYRDVYAADAFTRISEKTQTESVVGELRQSGL